jgi:hypothetical protein
MSLQRFLERLRQHGDAVLRALAVPHGDLLISKINIFHAQAHTLHETQARPVEQARHEMRRAAELR